MGYGQMPETGIGAEDMNRKSDLTRVAVRYMAILAVLIALGACSTLQFSYNNAEGLLRYTAWDYFDLDANQSDSLQQRFVRLREWHRSSELPVYVELLHTAGEKVAKGIVSADVDSARGAGRRAGAGDIEDRSDWRIGKEVGQGGASLCRSMAIGR